MGLVVPALVMCLVLAGAVIFIWGGITAIQRASRHLWHWIKNTFASGDAHARQ